MGIVDIGQQIPSILFRTVEKEFLNGIVIVVCDAIPDVFVPAFCGIPISLVEERPFPATIPVVGHDKGRCRHTDEFAVEFPGNRFDKVMDMIEHQGQCQNSNPIPLRHDSEDRIIDQPVLHGIEDDELVDGSDIDMLECIRRKLSFMASHDSFFRQGKRKSLSFRGLVNNLCCFSMQIMCFL